MKLVDLSIRRPVAITMGFLALVVFGIVSFSRLQLDLLPDVAFPTLTIRTEYAGVGPREMETLVSRPIEEAVGVVRGVRVVRSVSRAGQSDVTLEFAWGTQMDYAALDVRENLEVLVGLFDALADGGTARAEDDPGSTERSGSTP